MIYTTYLLNSLDTVFYDSEISADSLEHAQMLRNEAFSFQLAIKAETAKDEGWKDCVELCAEIETVPEISAAVYTIENVPAARIGYSISDDWFLRKTPGLYPDCLVTRENNYFSAPTRFWKTLLININEDSADIPDGSYTIKIRLFDREKSELVAERSVTLEVISAYLPKQDIITTNWMHYDCIAHFSGTRPFSDNFLKAASRYISMAAKNGQNMLLIPAFTPPLDTPVGEERATVQLVGVERKSGKYLFDFSMMKKFLELCLDCGIEYFEHSHLFTQWGAEHAPKIIVRENGEDKKLFGWHTDAASDEYKDFLHAYLTALKDFIKENGYEKRFFFHISDEPTKDNLKSYKSASDFMHRELEGYPSGDALSDYVFYEDGLVQTPITTTHEIGDFLGRAKPLWAYYTGLQSHDNLSNRAIGMPQERGRILGIQLYYFNIDGFLNWGFNAHHNRLSRMMVNPRISSDMDGDFISGTSYLVYPDGKDVNPSVRLMTFRDMMQDTRALRLLESLTDRNTVCALIKRFIPDIDFRCRVTAKQLEDLRNAVCSEIKNLL